jgi:hypothetical protein
MRLPRRVLILGFLAVLLAAVATATAAQDPVQIETALHKDGPWSTEGRNVHIPAGHSKNLYARITNTSHPNHPQDITLKDLSGATPGYHISWFKGNEDISHAVQTTGYDFGLKHGKTKKFRARVKVTDDSNQECLTGEFEVQPESTVAHAFFRVNGNGTCIV